MLEFTGEINMSLEFAIAIGKKDRHRLRMLAENPGLHTCRGCDRLTSAIYCCGSCGDAIAGKYEIHEDGILGHTDSCNARHKARSLPT